jgi:hypothetical protein
MPTLIDRVDVSEVAFTVLSTTCREADVTWRAFTPRRLNGSTASSSPSSTSDNK